MRERRSGHSISQDKHPPTTVRAIDRAILLVRAERVMLDVDLAALYGVTTGALNQAVKRNAFRLDRGETSNLKSQTVISSWHGGRRSPPLAFTEQGVAMLSSVLRSPRAIAVNVEIMRAFVRLRRLVISHADLAKRLDELEDRYDVQFMAVFEAIRKLMEPPASAPRARRIGF